MTFGIVVDWYGPYFDLDSLKQSAREYGKGDKVLYMGVTKGNVINYVGLSTSANTRFNYHHKLTENADKFTKFFIGDIVSQGIGGKKAARHPKDLKLAEHMLINVLYPDFNTVSKDNRPKTCGVLYSRFFVADGKGEYDPAEESPLPKFPAFVGYNSYEDSYEYSNTVSYA